eukprot:3709903-Prymnesium_polylepis.1
MSRSPRINYERAANPLLWRALAPSASLLPSLALHPSDARTDARTHARSSLTHPRACSPTAEHSNQRSFAGNSVRLRSYKFKPAGCPP